MANNKIENKQIGGYFTTVSKNFVPKDGSEGTPDQLLHRHDVRIDGIRYSFFALGTDNWIWRTDNVSFEYYEDKKGRFMINKKTLKTTDNKGKDVERGNRKFADHLTKVEVAQQ